MFSIQLQNLIGRVIACCHEDVAVEYCNFVTWISKYQKLMISDNLSLSVSSLWISQNLISALCLMKTIDTCSHPFCVECTSMMTEHCPMAYMYECASFPPCTPSTMRSMIYKLQNCGLTLHSLHVRLSQGLKWSTYWVSLRSKRIWSSGFLDHYFFLYFRSSKPDLDQNVQKQKDKFFSEYNKMYCISS